MSNVIKLNGKSAKVNVRISDESFPPLEAEHKDNSLEIELHNKYVAGFNDGQKDAANRLQKEYLEKLRVKYAQLDELMNHFTEQVNTQIEQFSQLVIETSFAIAEKIIQREIDNKSNISSVIESCLKKVLTANSILIKLNPQDYEIVLSDLKELNKSIDISKIKFEKDDLIQKGGCLVETEIGNADARISAQINELKRKIEQLKDQDNDI